MAACVNDVPLFNEDYHVLKNTSVCAGSNSYADDESSFQSDTGVEHYGGGSVQSFYMEDSVYQEQQSTCFVKKKKKKKKNRKSTRRTSRPGIPHRMPSLL
eukprot:TRINITY_DN71995_c0_g1_i1.p2 TRINITY_DN71995_c0_g1~~TRINITY_DN71995_c0_g1_i1.p2  ORF type:complete len:100 (+),score=9.57 TRINITY_DN71995_c0_g1_i1:213-512(+)